MQLSNEDYINKICINSNGLHIIIGLNGVGKSYLLEKIHKKCGNALLINSDGISRDNYARKMQDDMKRGRGREREEYSEGNNKCRKYNFNKYKIQGNKLSKGQIKLNSIIDTIEDDIYNKNFLLLDEPDTNLDNGLINILIKIIKDMRKDLKVIIVTHNSRLLELINIDIDNIYIKINKDEIINTTEDAIVKRYENIINNDTRLIPIISALENLSDTNNKKGKLYRMCYYYGNDKLKLLRQTVSSITKYSKLYDSLFFRYVILYEGATESEVMRYYLREKGYRNYNTMFSKERALLYMCIYKELGIQSVMVLDSDSDMSDKGDLNTKLNNYLSDMHKELFNSSIIFMNKNMEDELGIKYKHKQYYKDIVAAYAINNDANVKAKLDLILNRIIDNIAFS